MLSYGETALQSLKSLSVHLNFLRRTQLWFQILIGMILGVVTGLLLSPERGHISDATAEAIGNWLALPGELFLTLIQMVVIGLVFSSIVIGINAGDDKAALKRIGFKVIPFFIITTAIACFIGAAVAIMIEPGKYIDPALVNKLMEGNAPNRPMDAAAPARLSDLPRKIVSIIPTNVVAAAVNQEMLQVVVFAIFAGAALLAIPRPRAQPLLDVVAGLQEISLKIVAWAMVLAPYAVFGLLARITLKIGLDAILGMSVYVGTVLLGLALLLVMYLIIVGLLARRNPVRFLAQIRDVMLLAFSTSSSAAVMPLSVKVAEEKLHVRKAISQFVVPLGATVNMAGTALYQVSAAIFLAQVFNVDLTSGALVALIMTSVGASIGSPASPGVGIVILATLLAGIGVPPAGIALIIGVDRILDMARTAVNVTGDLVACTVVERWSKPVGDVAPST
ncbi:MAG: dicarboxylate/amino acid:cation symporter [Alphaproteobacteria bacterium]|nr:MAG: dicarboxylate/amino acid:cation symporter [Alphaproteobacteria bacterium]